MIEQLFKPEEGSLATKHAEPVIKNQEQHPVLTQKGKEILIYYHAFFVVSIQNDFIVDIIHLFMILIVIIKYSFENITTWMLSVYTCIGNPKVRITITLAPKIQYSQTCQFSLVLPKQLEDCSTLRVNSCVEEFSAKYSMRSLFLRSTGQNLH